MIKHLLIISLFLFLAGSLPAQNPNTPVLDSVSVTEGDSIVLGWPANTDGITTGYIIYHLQKSDLARLEIDRVNGVNNTLYYDLTHDPSQENHTYCLNAFDATNNPSQLGTLDQYLQSSIYLEAIDYNPCSLEATLQWTEYIHMKKPLAGYEIFISQDGGTTYTLAGSTDANTTTYTLTGLMPYLSYRYFIRAYSEGRSITSSSNRRNLFTGLPAVPATIPLLIASVEENEYVNIQWITEPTVPIHHYEIHRSADGTNWELAGELDEASLYYPNPADWQDEDIDLTQGPWYFNIIPFDSCGFEVSTAQSNTSKTIYLTASSPDIQTNHLQWTAYEGWPQGVSEYIVYRKNGDALFSPIGSVNGSTLEYTDAISMGNSTSALFTYKIEALENAPTALQSRSNYAITRQESLVFVPTAFRPSGLNARFQPVMQFVDSYQYTFMIFNRFGQQIFHTNQPDQAWDGTINGSMAPMGVYAWVLKYVDKNGQNQQKTGSVTLLQ